ncbi:MAG TPA: aldehyde dehydrogenase family protein, partial [Actinomycetota bacterium]
MGDVKTFKMYIGGEWTDATDGNTRQIVSPANGDVIAEVPEGTAADVDRAVGAAKKAYDETWSDATPGERMRALLKMADLVEEHGDELGRLESENVGKVLALTMSEEIPVIADQFRFFASGARVLE